MRIACVHVPQFALQSLSRIDPALRGAAVAVVGGGFDAAGARPSQALHSPVVVACSRAAWQLGVRLGMTASAARFLSSELRVVLADPQLERETVRAIADALLGVSPVVDAGGQIAASGTHLALYCQVPGKVRATTFGERLLELVGMFGVTARVGIADDRFTAWVAASHGATHAVVGGTQTEHTVRDAEPRRAARTRPASRKTVSADAAQGEQDGVRTAVSVPQQPTGRRRGNEVLKMSGPDDRGVVCVPRGGSAAFLAPRPLSLLAITPEVQHVLEALGVRTLGEFAALPAPSVSRPLEADYQALARGDSGTTLRPYAPEAPICEELIARQADNLFGDASAVSTLARRVSLRLAGRARAATRLDLVVLGDGSDRAMPIAPAKAARTEHELTELIAPVLGEGGHAVGRLRVVVVSEAIAEPVVADAGRALDAASSAATVEANGENEATVDGAPGGSIEGGTEDDDGAAQPVGAVGREPDPAVDALTLALSGMPPRQRQRASLGRPARGTRPAGSPPWQLIAPEFVASDRRGHRRTRRAKSRRTQPIAQSQLFGAGKGEG